MKIAYILFVCLSFVFSFAWAPASFASDKECWNESKKICTLTGTLETQVYPGPPGYEDIKKGDAKEEGLYLRLDHPIIIHFKDWENKDAPATKSISIVQLTGDFDERRVYKLAGMKKRPHVTIQGEIFASFNAHHHTDFLMYAKKNIFVDEK
jgi:hypothetical protein